MNEELKEAIREVYRLAKREGLIVRFSMKVVDIDKVHEWEETDE